MKPLSESQSLSCEEKAPHRYINKTETTYFSNIISKLSKIRTVTSSKNEQINLNVKSKKLFKHTDL
jgi:hypothetical protein